MQNQKPGPVSSGGRAAPGSPAGLPFPERRPLRRLLIIFCAFLSAAAATWSQVPAVTAGQAQGPWLGQALPEETPVAFAPELFAAISPWVETLDFSPDGSLCLISVGSPTYANSKLYWSKCVGGVWTPFAEPPFTAGFKYSNEPVFLADGKTLQFTGMKSPGSKDLWTVSYSEKGWGEPVALPSPVNSEFDEFRGSYMRDGTIYFASERSGMNQVYRGSLNAAGGFDVSLVGPPVSIGKIEADPCIAPDGSYLVFMSCKDNKSANNYVSFSDGAGGWGQPISLGFGFNTANDEYGAHLSADGKYFFFTRHGKAGNTIFWVSVSAIEKLRR
jgi:Tol biopolymer transport system component